MELAMLQKIMYPPPNWIAAISAATLVFLAHIGFGEYGGKNMEYAKFWNDSMKKAKFSGRMGMLMGYVPAFLVCVSSFWVFPDEGRRILVVKWCLAIHFFKRIFEVLFIHKYSGYMTVETAITMTLSYFPVATLILYSQHLTQGLPSPSIDLICPGIVLFFIGLSGNFYHHFLLSKLRNSSNDKEYKIPKGGLFDLVICPHYFFETLGFLGVAFISQTLFSFCFAFGSALYLMGRSYATRRWYVSKFEDFPRNVKAFVPLVF